MGSARPQHTCPRCGYDVSGVVPTWTEACPLEGTCSECGLVFAWVDIFRPERVYPAWSFEHAKERRIRAWWRTIWATLRPGKVWREMSMAAPIRVWRLVALALSIALIVHVLMVGFAGALMWDLIHTRRWGTPVPFSGPGSMVMVVRTDWNLIGELAAWPYSLTIGRMIDWPTLLLLLWGVMIPLPFFVLVDTMRMAKCRQVHLLRGAAYFTGVLGVIALLGGIVAHVPALFYSTWASSWLWIPGVWLPRALLVGGAVWYVRWWMRFAREYLRLPNAAAVARVMLGVSVLAGFVATLLLDRQFGYSVGAVVMFFWK